MIFYLIRHGKSHANTNALVTGDCSDQLSSEGIEQCKNLKVDLNLLNLSADIWVTSQWLRAKQTAEILWPKSPWVDDCAIGETNAGDVSNWKLSCFLEKYPNFYSNPRNKYPLGESHYELNQRVIAWFENILSASSLETKVVMVTHSGPISCILQHVSGVGMAEFPAFLVQNASISVLDIPENNVNKAEIREFSVFTTQELLSKNIDGINL